jgi:hypothetical protein
MLPLFTVRYTGTGHILTTLNPDWRPFRLKIGTLGNGDYDRYTGKEPILTTLNPDWRPFRLKIGTLCNGDYDRYTRTEPILTTLNLLLEFL